MFKYDPHLKTESQIKSTFINGKKILADILDDLKPTNNRLLTQSIIITGQRGTGKTHFLRMLDFSIKEDKVLNKKYLSLVFPEELYGAGSLYHFLKDALNRLFKELPSTEKIKKSEENFKKLCMIRFKGAKKEQIEERIKIENEFFSVLNNIRKITKKKIIFFLENLQDLFGTKLSTNELKQLRAFLQDSSDTLLIIGTALSIFDKVQDYGEPFYNFFKFRRLTGFNHDEVIEFLKAEGEAQKNPDILKYIENNTGKIEVFRILTGGNPRLILFLYDLLSKNNELSIDDILNKVTELTPYFKAETENLSNAQQMILEALCEGEIPAQTPSEIAESINDTLGIVNENLTRLLEQGKVKIVETKESKDVKKSETFYTVSDYFYRIWHQIRSLNESIKWMAELAALIFDKKELGKKCESCNSEMLKSVYLKALKLQEKHYFKELEKLIKEDTLQTKDLSENENITDMLKLIIDGTKFGEAKDYKNAIPCFKKALEIKPLLYLFKEIKFLAHHVYNEKKSISILTGNNELVEKIHAVEELICLNKFNGIETIFASLFSEIEQLKPQKELKELYLYFMFETILRLNNESEEPNPQLTAHYFLKTALLLDDKRTENEKIFEFLINYIKNTDKEKINLEGIENIFEDWQKNNIELPQQTMTILKALKEPDSRTAQVWSADPLFKEIINLLKSQS